MCLSIDLKAVQLALVCGVVMNPAASIKRHLTGTCSPQNLYPELESCLNGEGSECDVGSCGDSKLVERLP